MGRSTSISCFKIIACGSASADKSELEQTESKASTDKRGWSFSRRSGRHRVLSNSVISELPSAGNKESPEAANNDFHAETNSIVPEKNSVTQWEDETPQYVPSEANSELPDNSVTENDSCSDRSNLQEPAAAVIQAAIRGFLAQRAFSKHKSVVKLQAAVRGHLVRRQAVGTLRCVQAIVKMQALVRARRVRLSAEGLGIQEKLGDNIKTNNQKRSSLEKENPAAEANMTYSSQKLITNAFTRQLLESMPKKKRIRITCDPSKPDSAWKWLERWMSVSSLDIVQQSKPHVKLNCHDQGDAKLTTSEVETEVQVEAISDSPDSSSDIKVGILLEGDDNFSAESSDDFEFQSRQQTEVSGKSSISETGGMEQSLGEISSSATEVGIERPLNENSNTAIKDEMEQPHLVDVDLEQEVSTYERKVLTPRALNESYNIAIKDEMNQPQLVDANLEQEVSTYEGKVLTEVPDSLSKKIGMQSDETVVRGLDSLSDKLEVDEENSNLLMNRVASEQLEAEGKKFVFGPRKSANPAFVAVQSKFEELSMAASSDRHSISSTHREVVVQEKWDSHTSQMDSVINNKDLSLTEGSTSHDLRHQIGGSNYRTELSSPDRSEVEGRDVLPETGTSIKGDSFPNGISDIICDHDKLDAADAEGKKLPTSVLEVLPTPSSAGLIMSGKADDINEDPSDSPVDVDKVEQQQPSENIKLLLENNPVIEQPVDGLLQGGSPKSHITAPDSYGTPSSQVSLNNKGDKSDSIKQTQKRKFHSIGKRSPSQHSNDSSARNSVEHLSKESKNGKRRNSFDHEPRVSNGNSLPSYMQATESARARVLSNNSPKSSPDIQDRDIYIKKRHSLPVTNGKQGSPRMQRSVSQTQQAAKGNGTHSPQNSTERRWQR